MIEISRWNDTFENADTRKRQRLKSFHCPSGVESRGLVNLLCYFPNKDALAAFGVFLLICQLSATLQQKHRGRLLHSDGTAMTPEYLSRLLRIEICHLSAALEILSDQRVGWIKIHEPADNLPTICHLHPDFVQGEGEVEGEVEERESAPAPEEPPKQPKAAKSNPFEDRFPKAQAAEFERITKRINACNPRWRPQLTRMEMDALQANVWVLSEIVDSDWNLLRAYMHADIDPGLGKFWQPDGRLKMIESITDVLTHAEKWKTACRRNGIATGLDDNQKSA